MTKRVGSARASVWADALHVNYLLLVPLWYDAGMRTWITLLLARGIIRWVLPVILGWRARVLAPHIEHQVRLYLSEGDSPRSLENMMATIAAPQSVKELASVIPQWVSGVQSIIAGEGPSGLVEPIGSTAYFAAYMTLGGQQASIQSLSDEDTEAVTQSCIKVISDIDAYEQSVGGEEGFHSSAIGDRLRGLVKIKGLFQDLLAMFNGADIDWDKIMELIPQILSLIKMFL